MRRLVAMLCLGLVIVVGAELLAQGAPYYKWRSRINGREFCLQTSPGEGWDRVAGPYKDARCTTPASVATAETTLEFAEPAGEEVGVADVLETPDPASPATPDAMVRETTAAAGVTMSCGGGTKVQIRASNSSGSTRRCDARCNYKTRQGYAGTLSCSGNVAAGASNVLFCNRSNSSESPYTIASPPGSFTCR
jgi:hypothetical protein